MESYDNDIILLLLDDDLFWHEDDSEECGDTSTQTQQGFMSATARSEQSARRLA
jgi:hypothetical protein